MSGNKKSWNIQVRWFDCPYLEQRIYLEDKCYKPENRSKICKKNNCPIKVND